MSSTTSISTNHNKPHKSLSGAISISTNHKPPQNSFTNSSHNPLIQMTQKSNTVSGSSTSTPAGGDIQNPVPVSSSTSTKPHNKPPRNCFTNSPNTTHKTPCDLFGNSNPPLTPTSHNPPIQITKNSDAVPVSSISSKQDPVPACIPGSSASSPVSSISSLPDPVPVPVPAGLEVAVAEIQVKGCCSKKKWLLWLIPEPTRSSSAPPPS
jgi:hypothetical protein